MKLKPHYKKLNWIGLILFITGIICDGNAIDYLRYLSIIGVILFTIGTLIWIPLRIRKPILEPYNSNKYASVVDAGLAFLFNNLLLEFWGFCMYMGMIAFMLMSLGFRNTASYQAATELLENSQEVKEQIGTIQSFGFMITGSAGSTSGNLGFSVYGTKMNAYVSVNVEKNSSNWQLKELKIE